jgi:riboflavin kinase
MEILRGNKELKTGIYYGLSSIESVAGIRPCVISVGWNPFYKNEKKTIEAHVMSSTLDDFYDARISLCLLGYLRDECNFGGLDELISCIRSDISLATEKIASHQLHYKYSSYAVDDTTGVAAWTTDI